MYGGCWVWEHSKTCVQGIIVNLNGVAVYTLSENVWHRVVVAWCFLQCIYLWWGRWQVALGLAKSIFHSELHKSRDYIGHRCESSDWNHIKECGVMQLVNMSPICECQSHHVLPVSASLAVSFCEVVVWSNHWASVCNISWMSWHTHLVVRDQRNTRQYHN